MRAMLTIFLTSLLANGVANAQAFGVEPGAPVSRYNGKVFPEGGPFRFEIKVPQPNREFEGYMATATPETGICSVTGVGATYENDNYGVSARTAYSVMKEALRAKYGTYKEFDSLEAGARWKQPREWVWSIFKNERTVSSFWDEEARSSLPVGIRRIGLQIKAIDATGAYLSLRYEFANFDQCPAGL